ncbi:HAUS augmin-like complex subunit 3 isoform X1 [Trachemys scripta elegans]|uniref:HAUS augmin-like complex subunit 3 n=2 Tax=Emydidae TaxID=8476 RepID=UPI00155183DA|nr:HAUS augmin-like complex subunit 3 isoform X1 [Trachemys scripta elegans]XP_034626602.1 HAUS augmin-like complex subunit 3 isoform X1 [Trachemys scripta elegans]XP_034626603.1 HAUS augmin-like complex subunit 3 isoform X1 [Trachemys scripta elegans]XP_053885664.1 HAUS augmin-like complex subunit 3 [Malaclemys terrapin pileata]
MNSGNQFVETLKKVGYPKAAQLNGEDFDWLFETVEDKSFLEWFCGNVNEQHVLTEKELQAFDALLKSGKPILEEEALDEVLKTCKTFDSKSSSMEEGELQKLEEEFQALQKIKNLKIHRRNKLQMMASTNSHMSLKLNDKAEEAAKILKERQGIFTTINTKINNELHSLTEGVKKLTFFFTFSDSEQGLGPHPVFLSQLALDKYLCQEEKSTAALTSYTKKQFFQGISELVESSNEENFQLVDISKPLICDENNEVCKERLEMARLQMAYICAQHQLIQRKAKDLSINSAVQWAENNLQSLKNKTFGKEHLEARISSLNSDISKIKKQLTQINNEILPSLVKENAQLLNMPVVKGDFDLQIARQDYYTSRQDQVCNQLLKQKASFELLQLAYEIELRKHRDIHRQLENIIQDLKQSSKALEQRLEMMSDPLITQHAVPRNTIDSRDGASHRLYQLLEGENQKQQLFRTHDGIEQVAQKLKQDITSVQDQLAVSSQEQFLFLSKLDSDLDALCDSLYCGGNKILLSNQELTEQLYQLEVNLNKLNQLIMDLLADVKAKRKVLETNTLHQMERKLYVYFFKDEDYLKDIVEKLEHQSQAQTVGLED